MNKIYRRLWSTARQCWVVASELATAGKASGARRSACIAALPLALGASLLVPQTADATIFWGCDKENGLRTCFPFIGHDGEFKGADATWASSYYMMMGNGAFVDGSYVTGYGHQIKIHGSDSTGFGYGVNIRGDSSTAIGYRAEVKQGYSTILGARAVSDGIGSVSVGNRSSSSGENGIAVGSNARNASGAGNSRIAIGGNSYAGSSGYTGAVALGGESRAEFDGVAVGYAAKVTASKAQAMGRGAAASAEGAMALGADAKASGSHAIALGRDTQALGRESFALGKGARADGWSSLAMGAGARSQAEGGLAFGYQAQVSNANAKFSVALGEKANASHANAVALGAGSVTTGTNQISVGSSASKRRIVNVDDGSISASSTDAVTGRQLHAVRSELNATSRMITQNSPSGGMRIGVDNSGNQIGIANSRGEARYLNGVRNGTLSSTSTDAVNGRQLNATNTEVASVRTVAATAQTAATAAKVAADDALVKANALGGLVSQAAADGNVRLGGENTGAVLDVRNQANANRTLSGLKDGAVNAASTEAVTGRQLQAAHDRIETAQSRADTAHSSATAAQATANQAKAKADATGNAVATAGAIEDRNRATATGNLAMAMGQAAKANGVAAFAMGHSANATGDNAVSLGSASAATAKAAVALGGNAKARHENSVALGERSETSGANEVSVGNAATKLKRRIVNVDDARLTDSSTDAVTGKQLFATDEKVQANEAVLAGHTRDLAAHSGRIADNRRDLDALRSEFDGFDPDLDGVVKFAADGSVDMASGTVRNVAAGDISSAASKDAVNGGQLFATNRRVDELEGDARFFSFGSDSSSEAAAAGDLAVAIGDSAQASIGNEGGVAVGSYSNALAINSVALGRAALVSESATNGFSLGAGSRVEAEGGVALGASARVDGANSVAIGNGAIATEAGVVSFGDDEFTRRLTRISRGTADSDAVAVSQVKEVVAALGGGSRLDGNGGLIAPAYNVQGGMQNNVGDALSALDRAVVTSNDRVENLEGKLRSAFQDGPSVRANGLNQLTLAGANGSVLTNLADGRIAAGSRDAVTGSQLFEAKQEIARNRSDLDDMQRRGNVSGLDTLRLDGSVLADVNFGGARLTGVSDGRVASTSSDVVTGAQLFGTNERVSSLEASGRVVAVSSSNGSNSEAKIGSRAVAVGEFALASRDSEGGTAVGYAAAAYSRNSVAIGSNSWVSSSNEGGIAIGPNAKADGSRSLAIGDRAWAFGDNSVAVGPGSEAMRSNEFSIGSYSNRRRLTYVANGIRPYDAATAGQLRESLEVFGGGSTLDGQGLVVAPTYRVQGGVQSNVGDALASLDAAVVTNTTRTNRVESQLNAVFQDSPTVRNDGLNQLTFAGANGMVLSNVANGVVAAGSRDAVNGGQLHSMQQQLNGRMDGLEHRIDGQPHSRALATVAGEEPSAPKPPASAGDKVLADNGNAPKSAPQPQADTPKPESPKPQVDTAELEKMLARANEYSDGVSREVDRRLDKMDKRFNRMAAMSSAQSAMAMNTAGLATYNRLGAGVGYSDGESAMAVGYQRVLNEKGSATFSLNGAFTNSGERTVGVGVGIGW